MQVVKTFAKVRKIVPDVEDIFSFILIVLFIFQRESLRRPSIERQSIESRTHLHNGRRRDTEAADRIDASNSATYAPIGSFATSQPPDGNLLAVRVELAFRRLRGEFGD